MFAKGCEFLLVFLGEGFGVRFRWVVGGGFPVENKERAKGGGEGGAWGGDRQRNRQVNAQALSKLPLWAQQTTPKSPRTVLLLPFRPAQNIPGI